MADSESGRGSLYADVIPGGYETLEMEGDFSPRKYIEAVQIIEQSGAVIGIMDSGSHEWEGINGVLDMAVSNEERSGKAGLHNWKTPKMEHAKFMLKLLQSPIPWIICLRAKYKSRQTKDEKGKTVIVKDEATSPIQADDFIFEMTAHAEILSNHSIILTKCSHPALRDCFPKDKTEPISIKHGEAIARWCANPSGPGVASTPLPTPKTTTAQGSGAGVPAPTSDLEPLKKHFWKITQAIHGGVKDNFPKLQQWAWNEDVIAHDKTLADLCLEEWETAIVKAQAKLKQMHLV